MLYGKNREEKLSKKTFRNPPAQFRGAPFWAWNSQLEKNELLWQIDRLKEMGFGGFFMHSRSGMSTEYLSKDFMELIRSCTEYAKENGLLAYLYDEDRWPSGAAGGYVTKDKAYRQKMLYLSLNDPEKMQSLTAKDERDPTLIATFDVRFDDFDRIAEYRVISPSEAASGEKWYAYVLISPCSGWHNGYTHLDMMDADAVDKFIDVTYEAYKNEVGDEFGKTIPAIFTDEPDYGVFTHKEYARDGKDAAFPWTNGFADSFTERFGYDIVGRLPELVWNLADDRPSTARYDYYAHASELFARSYSDRIGRWCAENGIDFTGHLLMEASLYSQMLSVGEAMRQYREYTVPGIDMLSNAVEFSTAKQAQSVAHQCGRSGMMSELYGVTGWDFDFRGHKFQGDWQAALGVTLRVHHLSWVSMQGSAKRDYPASIGYQSAWYKEYEYIENHFARVNTALTRGKPKVNIAVIHPIESMWTTCGVREHTSEYGRAMDEQFQNVIGWLLRNQMDFDFISESMLPELYRSDKNGFTVGEMQYSSVVVPPLVTIRSTTLAALGEYIDAGGKVLVSGKCLALVDGKISDAAENLYARAQNVVFCETDILNALESEREVSILSQNGSRRKDLIYSLRTDGADRWLFIAHCDKLHRIDGADYIPDRIRITVKGHYVPELYDTINGSTQKPEYGFKNGNTVITVPCYALDSFLFLLMPCDKDSVPFVLEKKDKSHSLVDIQIPDFVDYSCAESNVILLDMCEWSLDEGKTFRPREEVLRIDSAIRKEFGFPLANGMDVQPWCIPALEPSVFVWLRFTFESEFAAICKLGYERLSEVLLNGKRLSVSSDGYFVDKNIKTMPLPELNVGKNELLVKVPISERISIENVFLLGDFGVNVRGSHADIVKSPEKLAFGSIVGQGLPFYGAEITYKIPFECAAGDITVTTNYYIGAVISARLDGKDAGKIVLPPYKLTLPDVSEGKHVLELTLYASRINTFGAVHLCVPVSWRGPNMWYTYDNGWAYEYQLTDIGIMKKPTITLHPKAKK